MTVSGNRAVIGIDASLESTISGFVGFLVQGALIEVIDGGVQMDSQGFVPLAAPPTACPSTFTAGQDPVLLAFADLVVTDSQPLPSLPTSKEQCKNGGWRNFGVFKNQGDCVSFVAIGGKNPPGGP